MAQFESETYTKQSKASENAAALIGTAELISGKSAFLQTKLVAPTGTAAGDTILLGYLPSGMSVIPSQSTLTTDGALGADPASIGVEGNPTAISGATPLDTTGTAAVDSTVGSFKSDKREAIMLTLTGALNAGATAYFSFTLVNSN